MRLELIGDPEAVDNCTAFLSVIGDEPPDAMMLINEVEGTVVARDGGKGDVDGAVNGRIQAHGLKPGKHRLRFEKDGEVETFHRPHPAKEAKRYQVRAARAFLERIGVTP